MNFLRRWFGTSESATEFPPESPKPSEAELAQARALLVKFDTDRPTALELSNGLRTLLGRIGEAELIPEEFGDPDSPRWKYDAMHTLEGVRQIMEYKRRVHPAKTSLYDQAIRLTHAIQSSIRAERQPSDLRERPNAFLRDEDLSEKKKHEDRARIDANRAQYEASRERKERSLKRVAQEFLMACEELEIDIPPRTRQLMSGVEAGAINFQQFLQADATFSDREKTPSVGDRLAAASGREDPTIQPWVQYAKEMTDLFEALTARGSTVDTVIIPLRPTTRVRKVAVQEEVEAQETIAAK